MLKAQPNLTYFLFQVWSFTSATVSVTAKLASPETFWINRDVRPTSTWHRSFQKRKPVQIGLELRRPVSSGFPIRSRTRAADANPSPRQETKWRKMKWRRHSITALSRGNRKLKSFPERWFGRLSSRFELPSWRCLIRRTNFSKTVRHPKSKFDFKD